MHQWRESRWLGAEQRRRHARLPARYGPAFVRPLSVLGLWLAKLNGAGLVASIAIMIAAYTSLPGASDICVASRYVADISRFAEKVANHFLWGGLLTLLVGSAPELIRLIRNFGRDPFSRPHFFTGPMILLVTAKPLKDVAPEAILRPWGDFQRACHSSLPSILRIVG